MSTDRRRDYPLKAAPRAWLRFFPRDWYLRLRLRWATHGIARLERQLAGEFGSLDLAPLHRELAALIAERDALQTQLAIDP